MNWFSSKTCDDYAGVFNVDLNQEKYQESHRVYFNWDDQPKHGKMHNIDASAYHIVKVCYEDTNIAVYEAVFRATILKGHIALNAMQLKALKLEANDLNIKKITVTYICRQHSKLQRAKKVGLSLSLAKSSGVNTDINYLEKQRIIKSLKEKIKDNILHVSHAYLLKYQDVKGYYSSNRKHTVYNRDGDQKKELHCKMPDPLELYAFINYIEDEQNKSQSLALGNKQLTIDVKINDEGNGGSNLTFDDPCTDKKQSPSLYKSYLEEIDIQNRTQDYPSLSMDHAEVEEVELQKQRLDKLNLNLLENNVGGVSAQLREIIVNNFLPRILPLAMAEKYGTKYSKGILLYGPSPTIRVNFFQPRF